MRVEVKRVFTQQRETGQGEGDRADYADIADGDKAKQNQFLHPNHPRNPRLKNQSSVFPLCTFVSFVGDSSMLDLATVRCEQFASCLDQDFEIVFKDGTLPMKLSEARPLGVRPESIREPFSLSFAADRPLRLPQGTYTMRHPQLGEMEIFLVQVAADANTSTFEAVFN